MRHSLLAFVDPKDPFPAAEIEGEPLPGAILSILSARPFTDVFLFHTPHTHENGEATVREIRERHPHCRTTLVALPIADPKDYSAIMGALGRHVRRIVAELAGADHSVCVSSGTAEMRAAWFLLHASHILPGRLLQVGTPDEPLYGASRVKEVALGDADWSELRDLVMPVEYFAPPPPPPGASPAQAKRARCDDAAKAPAAPWLSAAMPAEAMAMPEPPPGLEEALRELSFHIYSPQMQLVAQSAATVAAVDEAALIYGETGTGKELVARLIHRLSPRRHKAMITVNCGAIPEELAESHLFGHVRGAFTGAVNDGQGVFEAAHGGTLFLDEIAELSPACQAKLLRAVQFGEFSRVGSTKTSRVDVRVIAATHRSLPEEVAKGGFRNDLYQRLSILPLSIPPLRERAGEIVPLALAFLKSINERRQHPRQLSKEALQRLEAHSWPGNVRELEAVLKRSVIFSAGPVLHAGEIMIGNPAPGKDPFTALPEPSPEFKLERFLDEVRRHLILRALEKAGGNQTAAAALLGISKQAVSKFLADNRG